MLQNIKKIDIKNKKVIIRCDFNVPMENGKIKDDTRIVESLPTIEYAIEEGAKIILLSHLGRIKTEEDKKENTLKPIAEHLSKLLNKKVTFINQTRGAEVEEKIENMKSKSIILLENTRFEDLDGKKESSNDEELAKYWASLGEVFINDAFGTVHRAHASNAGIAKYLPSGIGLLMEKELKYLKKATQKPKKPYTVILGGSKVSDKINVIDNLVKKADYILIGGAMAFTFLKAAGFEIGKSINEPDKIGYCTDLLDKYSDKIVLPIDIITSDSIDNANIVNERFINEIKEDEIGLDIGTRTIKVFKQYLEDSKTIFWNGPVGFFEYEKFEKGTKGLLEILSNSKATTIIGGGDTTRAAIGMGYKNKIDHISTGGGASLELLEGKPLKALEALNEKK